MDGGTITPINPFLTGEILTASATLSACAAWIASCIRRQTVRRRTRMAVARNSSLSGSVKPLISGEYRGRSVQMAQTGEWLTVTVRLSNRGVFAEFGGEDAFPALWLTNLLRKRLDIVARKWSVAVRGRSLFLSCHAVHGPERLRASLELACDLADAVDLTDCPLNR